MCGPGAFLWLDEVPHQPEITSMNFETRPLSILSPLPLSAVGEGQGEGLRTCRVAIHGATTARLTTVAGDSGIRVPLAARPPVLFDRGDGNPRYKL
jgi:hypothetical protein